MGPSFVFVLAFIFDLLCFVSVLNVSFLCLVPNVACVYELSIFDCPLQISLMFISLKCTCMYSRNIALITKFVI